MKKIFLIFVIVIFHWNADAQFFEKLKTERLESNPNVVWKSFAPGTSGYCEEFFVHPTDDNTMFMAPDMHAAFGTWDNGKSWQTIKDYDGTGIDMRRVIDIKFSLQDANYGIAFANRQNGSSTSGEMYETLDKGRSWKLKSVMGKCHSKLAIHPTNDNIWFLGAGDFWNVKDNHRNLANPNGIIQSRANYGYVWKTTNKGATWKKVATNLSSSLDVGRIIFDPTQPNTMIMATGQGMYRSTNLGETWTSSATGLPNNLPRDLTSYYNPTSNEFVLYAVEQSIYTPNGPSITTSGGVYKSTDSGLTWQNITGNLGLNMQSITDYTNRENYHRTIAYWLGIDKSTSKATYTSYPSNVLQVFSRIVVNPMNKNEIYLLHNSRHDFSFGPGDIWKTTNGGVTWEACSRAGTYWSSQSDKSYWQSKNDPLDTNITFAHLQKEIDDSNESASGARMLAINSVGNVFTGINQQLLRTNNAGDSWEQADDDETAPGSKKWVGRGGTALPGRFMLLETGVTGRKLLCSGEHGLWQTTDSGTYPHKDAVAIEQLEGQNNTGGAHSISTVAVHPNDPSTIFMLMWRQEHRGKLRKSTDGGKTWTNISTIFEASNGSWESVALQYCLTIDPVNTNNMYFCSIRKEISEVGSSPDESVLTKGGFGFYKSTDGGVTWNLSNTGLPANSSLRRIAMHADNPQIIYAAINQWSTSDPGGLYKSIDGGNNWSKQTIPSVITSVNNIFIDKNTKHLFMSTGSRNGAVNAGGVWRSIDNGVSWTRIFEAPYVWQAETSPANSNIIMIAVSTQVSSGIESFINPGIFISANAGTSWSKINKGLAHADRIVDVKPDPIDQNIVWSAGWGSGWYKAKLDASILAVNDFKKSSTDYNLHPNPIVNGILNLTNVPDNTRYCISDMQGRNMKSGVIVVNESVDVSQLKSGIYIIRIATSGGDEMRKFIVR